MVVQSVSHTQPFRFRILFETDQRSVWTWNSVHFVVVIDLQQHDNLHVPAVNLLTTDCGLGNCCCCGAADDDDGKATVMGCGAGSDTSRDEWRASERVHCNGIYGNQTVAGTKSKLHPINQILVEHQSVAAAEE